METPQTKETTANGLCILLLSFFERYFKRYLLELNNFVIFITFTISEVFKPQFILFCERSKKPKQPFLLPYLFFYLISFMINIYPLATMGFEISSQEVDFLVNYYSIRTISWLETIKLNQEYFQRLDFVFQLYVDQYCWCFRTFLSQKSIFKSVSFWKPLGQFEVRLEQVCSFGSSLPRIKLVLVFLNLQRNFVYKQRLKLYFKFAPRKFGVLLVRYAWIGLHF